MLFHKEGLPEEGELVWCTVTSVQYHSVFCNMDEYGKTGMIHISEVSPGRIRNIRDFVKEGKKIVCKVLRINKEKEQIDLSLRRVAESQRREKVNWIKQEQKAEKLIEQFSKKINRDFKELYQEIFIKISKKYDSLTSCFSEVVAGNVTLENLGVNPDIAKELTEILKQRIKPEEVSIGGVLEMVTYVGNGVEVVKQALKKAQVNNQVKMRYDGAGKYTIRVTETDYKKAESILKEATQKAIDFFEKYGEIEFKRVEA